MAQKKSTKSEKTKIRRIKATDDSSRHEDKKTETPKVKSTTKELKKKPIKKTIDINESSRNPLNYFKGAWAELKQVRWPTRSATWSMTLAVLLFTAIFVVVILLLDAGFKLMFEQILK